MAKTYDDAKANELRKQKEKPRTYVGPANDYNDPVKAEILRKHEEKVKKSMVWRGDADIEDICQMFMDVLTSPSGVAALDIKA